MTVEKSDHRTVAENIATLTVAGIVSYAIVCRQARLDHCYAEGYTY